MIGVRRWLGRLMGLSYWGVVLALVGLNVWWLGRETRPLPSLKTISDWVREKRLDEAEAALREHLRRSPNNDEALMMLARLHVARGDDYGAARLVHAVPDWTPEKPETLFLEGQLFLGSQRTRPAEAAWLRCLALVPEGHEGAHLRARANTAIELIKLYLQQSRTDEARAFGWRVYEHAATADQEDLVRLRMEAELLQEPPKLRAERLRRYVAADPDDWQSRRALALEEQALGHAKEALALIDGCARARPDDLLVRRDLLFLLRAQGNPARFRDEIARLPAGCDRDPAIWKYRGLASEQTSDFAQARAAYQRAIALGGGDAESYYHLGLVERRLGHDRESAAALARSRRIQEASAQVYPAFVTYLEARKAHRDATEAITRLAALCRTAGWEREARAWLSVVGPSS